MNVADRFWSKVIKGPGCWSWTGCWRHKSNYPAFSVGGKANNKLVSAHRMAFELTKGPIPDGLVIRHDCDNRGCVNPDHLSAGSQSENIRDMVVRGRNKDRSGENNGMAQLTWEKVREIRSMAGTVTQIAEKFGISLSSASMILNNKRWREERHGN